MSEEFKKLLRDLARQGLIITDFDWADVEGGVIKHLTVDYRTKSGAKGTLDFEDIGVDLYEDDGDVCVDTMGGLYILEPYGIDDHFDDFEEDDPNIQRKDVPDIEWECDESDFYGGLMEYYVD